MAPRPRKKGNRDLPLNLYAKFDKRTSKTYYNYRDPRDGIFHGLGSIKQVAIEDATALNTAIHSAMRETRLQKIVEHTGPLFSQYTKTHMEYCEERGLAKNTIRSRRCMIKALNLKMGSIPVDAVTVKMIAEVLQQYRDEGKHRMAQSVRSAAIEVFKDAIADGHTDDNPAAKTRSPSVQTKRARLTLETFQTILTTAENSKTNWIANAILLAVVTGQRREDIARMKFKDAHDGYLHIKQRKTGTMVRIDTSLHLVAIDLSISDVINRCRDRVVSPYMIHQNLNHGNSAPGKPIHLDTISRRFADMRRESGLTWDCEPPSFHEIRSLSERLYQKQGVDTQSLLGHKDPRMTAKYHDARGHDWVEVNA